MEELAITTGSTAGSAGNEALEAAQELARALAAQLAHARPPPGHGDDLRLARALTLDIVDLLADACAGMPARDQPA